MDITKPMSDTHDKKKSKRKKTIRCPSCQKRKAKKDPTYGIISCDKCQEEGDEIEVKTREFTSSTIRGQRIEYQQSHYQPYVNGVLSKEFIEAHGTSKLAGVTKKDIKEAKYVYRHLPRWHKRKESKL